MTDQLQSNQESEEKPKLPNDGRPFLMILVNEDGSIKVSGHIDNKILAYGILDAAKDAIRANIEKKVHIERIPAPGGIINFLRNGYGRQPKVH